MPRNERQVPHNEEAEEAVLGAMLLSRYALEDVLQILSQTDFYRPAFGAIFAAMRTLHDSGSAVDPITVGNELNRLGVLEQVGGTAVLISLQASAPGTANAVHYANIVAEDSARRTIIAVVNDLAAQAYDGELSTAEIVDMAVGRLGETAVARGVGEVANLYQLDEFLGRPQEHRPQWVVPGLLRERWRCMVVAAEGIGKTVLFRQIAIAVAQGVHPLMFGMIPPKRVLIVDAENPEDSIQDVCNPITAQTQKVSACYDSDRAWLWHVEGGIDLRSRRGKSELEQVIQQVRPDLVCLGPLYKVYSVSARESDEQAAGEVMRVFDDLRTRYNFALLLEHHAPKGMGKQRDLMPYGSSLWLRWPELGIKLTPTDLDNTKLRVGRWRGDRLENAWPTEIERGGGLHSDGWLWRGVWPPGTPTGPGDGVPLRSPDEPIDEGPIDFDPRTGEVFVDEYRQPEGSLVGDDLVPF